ncbi:MAG: GNAT family N-acetyltransferase [Saprospiraceae bacterium]|nr:GNAT family N-acetyltransferase [Saprospiraceae bacterium]
MVLSTAPLPNFIASVIMSEEMKLSGADFNPPPIHLRVKPKPWSISKRIWPGHGCLKTKMFFLKNKSAAIIGSAMAWYGDGRFDNNYGRLHWVVIHPDFRGQGLGRQLIIFTMYQLSCQYSKAYLTTQTTSFQAIKIYLDLGFRPSISNSEDETAWNILRDRLNHPALF